MDWNLRTCARKGHVTYRPDEEHLADRLTARTAAGPVWRCLRCGEFVLGEPRGTGPAAQAPLVPRGKVLRDLTVLRLLAVERLVRAILLGLIAYGVLQFRKSESSVQAAFNRALPAAKPLAQDLHFDLDHSPTIDKLRHLLETSPHTLLLVAFALFGYAALQLVEGVGLWLAKRWGEYFAAVATSIFLPLEGWELSERVTVLRVGALLINVAAVVYLVMSKRLFGVRGGRAAFEAERESEVILEVDTAAGEPAVDKRATDEPAADEPSTDEPSGGEPAADEPARSPA